ncbi:MAG: hypothetical protein F9K10_03830 [Paludibacter sp.]|nr:MAG: hypothetical protein F9K10_03830 [Paludibacter sp.]
MIFFLPPTKDSLTFANSAGGWIVLGVAQRGKRFEIKGLSHPEKIEQNFTTVLRGRTKFNVLINPICKKYNIENLWEYYFAIIDRLKRYIDMPFKINESSGNTGEIILYHPDNSIKLEVWVESINKKGPHHLLLMIQPLWIPAFRNTEIIFGALYFNNPDFGNKRLRQ